MALQVTDNPRYVTTAGFGCIFNNYGLGPGTPQEPTIITKFFGLGHKKMDDYYTEEKTSHNNVIKRCGEFPTMSSIFGIDLNQGANTVVSGYPTPNNMKSYDGSIVSRNKPPGYPDVSPSLICETPNSRGHKLHSPIFFLNKKGVRFYPVIKMNNLGVDLFENPVNVNLNSFIQSFELMALLHTGMIHNDMKGNNMLVSPYTKRVSLIDFGLSTPFRLTVPVPPYYDRTYAKLRRPWYAYPPEYTFMRSSGTEFRNPSEFPEFTKEYIAEYDTINTRYKWANHAFLDKRVGESDMARETRIRTALDKIYNEYFDPALAIPNSKVFLQTAVTGDVYTLGLEHAFIYGKINRGDGLYGENDRTPVDVGTVEIKANDFMNRVSTMITALNPRYRPFHINILKLFKQYNRKLVPGATTFVSVIGEGGQPDRPYIELSILNGNPPSISVKSEMALGSPGCPIDSTEVIDNMKLLYFLIQKDDNEIRKLIYNNDISYIQLLDTANKFIATNPSTLFPRPPGSPKNSPQGMPTIVRNPLSFVNMRAFEPVQREPLSELVQLNPLDKVRDRVPKDKEPMVPADKEQDGHVKVEIYKFADHIFSPKNKHSGGRRKKMSGGSIDSLYICNKDGADFIKNLIQAGILAMGVYMSGSRDEVSSAIMKILEEKKGGRVATLTLKNNLNKTARIMNKTLIKLNRANANAKVNTTRKTRVNLKVENMPEYSDLQTECFINEIVTSNAPGKINLLYAHYLSYMSIEQQKEVIKLLIFVPLADPDVITSIIKELSNYTAVVSYLNLLKSSHVSKIGLDVSKTTKEIDDLVEKYISNTEDRYTMLLNLYN